MDRTKQSQRWLSTADARWSAGVPNQILGNVSWSAYLSLCLAYWETWIQNLISVQLREQQLKVVNEGTKR